MPDLRAILEMRAHNTSRSRVYVFPLGLPSACFARNPSREHKGIVKLPQDVLQILEALHSRSAATEQGSIQLGGVAKPATAPPKGMQSHRGEVSPQRAQLLDRHPSAFPAGSSQPQGGLSRICTAAR